MKTSRGADVTGRASNMPRHSASNAQAMPTLPLTLHF